MNGIHDNAAAYALVSLDAAEMAEFEAHLATCEFCQQEVVEFSESVAELSLLTQAAPPPALRSKVLAAIQDLPQLPAEPGLNGTSHRGGPPSTRPTSAGTPLRPSGPRRALPGSYVPEEPDTRGEDELRLRRQRRRTRILGGLVAALLLVTVGLGGVIYNLTQQRQEQVAQQTFEQQLLRAPDAQIVVVPETEVGGRCTFIVSRQLNRALYLGTNMPDPGQGKHYQLWTATGTQTELAPELDNAVPGTRPWKQFFRGDVTQADFLAVSIEQDGTTPDTPSQVVVLAELS